MLSLFPDDLSATAADVAVMTRSEREARLRALIIEANTIFDRTISEHVYADGRDLAATVILFSGGNDSTVLAHMFRHRATHAGHANTGVGIEATRQFVRDTCKAWDLPLIEERAKSPKDHYRTLVLERGFPGPAMHWKMYQRLKERALRQIKGILLQNPRKQRVVFIGGRRRDESARRAAIPENGRTGAIVWISPLIHWTKPDLNTYRLTQGDVPVNEVSDLIHMSGECLCGSFASPGERDELDYWFADDMQFIRDLEAEIRGRSDVPVYRQTWGWGAIPELAAQAPKRELLRPKAGGICGGCATLFDFDGAVAA